ncbi:MAG: DUF547 domain-containing protein [Xanthomonadales bacterium]|nr:DUF547 domain-containing protein [Xanthomonadales bacterium]
MALLLGAAVEVAEPAFDHRYADWGAFLDSVVEVTPDGTRSSVDYARAARLQDTLKDILARWSAVSRDNFDGWSNDQQLAFLINAYNAWTIALILTEYPDLESIKDLGSLFSSPWKQRFVPLFDRTVSLDHIEHDLIRGEFDDPRIHFAVNCASCGCPALRTEPYRPTRLDEQLSEARDRFLADRTRNRLRAGTKTAEISPIFKWYGEDFEARSGSVRSYLAEHGRALADTAEERDLLASGTYRIRYTDYDWQLNDVNRCPEEAGPDR